MIIDFDNKNKGGGGKEPVVEALNVTANGTYNAPSGVDGFTPVEVNVPQKTFNKTSVTKEYTANGQYSIATPDGYDGISDVSVNVNVASSGGGGKFGAGLNNMKITTNEQTIDFSNLDTSTFTSMSTMFQNCSSLTSLDLSSFNTSKVTDMYNMFRGCKELTSINMSGWNTSNVTNMSYMFFNCLKLTSIDVSHFDTSNVTNMSGMFTSCSNITSLDLSSWNTSNVTNMTRMFNSCSTLTTIISDGLQLPNIDMSTIGLNSSPLTVDSIVGLLNALPQSTKNYNFQIGNTNIAKLSEEQKAIATNKNWELV